MRAIQAGSSPCNDGLVERCAAEAELALTEADRVDPKSWRLGYLMSKVLAARGDTVRAAALLTRTCPSSPEGDVCWREAVLTAIKSRVDREISTAANAFAVRPCGGSQSCAESLDWLANNLASGDQHALASTFYVQAAEADPSAARWLKVAEHASQAHLYGIARTALERADRSPDNSLSSREHAEVLRQNLVRAAAPGTL